MSWGSDPVPEPTPVPCPDYTFYSGSDEQICVSPGVYFFIGDIPYGLILIVGISWAINITLWAIAVRKNREIHPPFGYFIFSLVQNLCFGLFIWGIMHQIFQGTSMYTSAFAISLFILIFSNIFSYKYSFSTKELKPGLFLTRKLIFKKFCQCCLSFHLGFQGRKKFPIKCVLNEEKAEKLAKRVSGNPPILIIKPIIKNGFEKHKVVFSEPLKYGSWEGMDDLKIDPNCELTIFKANFVDEISEDFQGYLKQASEEYYRKLHAYYIARQTNYRLRIKVFDNPEMEYEMDIYKVPKYFSLCHNSKYVKFLNSCFGKFLFVILNLFGFSIIFDDIFYIMAKYQEIEVKRKIALDGSLRFKPYKANPQFSNDYYTAEDLSYCRLPYWDPELYLLICSEMQKSDCTDHYALSMAFTVPLLDGGFGYPIPQNQGDIKNSLINSQEGQSNDQPYYYEVPYSQKQEYAYPPQIQEKDVKMDV
ncbi:hypothetical protein TVAG_274790 [Trichomonas vaginalis G3]|uniref:Uncharacterized protein n=1 Tax=Trichomonas vaginalis (strain ATCC PRA-98 / G3) TaxID=412133 RepID=A2EB69_TRIV3|nr:hypothetical protein TVAGG3_0354130 [Trichomonas vaginalis G3]EAY10115.1 hypothetical protein TVAG_274790 [Trichomonas vaginalis G3]KAI5531511.1 hypothetical protein TVAGG3_0354130 [Trichomonas vaginalis G3]|eukprot:XP_001322338.1 hypothetical protein [Trichomonas vaginalis G3]